MAWVCCLRKCDYLFVIYTFSFSCTVMTMKFTDFHHNFLTPYWAVPLARLTYGAFLFHNINQIYDIGVTRSPPVLSASNCVSIMWTMVSLLNDTCIIAIRRCSYGTLCVTWCSALVYHCWCRSLSRCLYEILRNSYSRKDRAEVILL